MYSSENGLHDFDVQRCLKAYEGEICVRYLSVLVVPSESENAVFYSVKFCPSYWVFIMTIWNRLCTQMNFDFSF